MSTVRSRETPRVRQFMDLVKNQDYRCALTGRPLTPEVTALDHRIPVSRGGSIDALENMQAIIEEVNRAKHTMTNEEFIAMCREVVAWADREKTAT